MCHNAPEYPEFAQVGAVDLTVSDKIGLLSLLHEIFKFKF